MNGTYVQADLAFVESVPAKSKYRISQQPRGFIIDGRDRNPVTVTAHATGFTVQYTVPQYRFFEGGDPGNSHSPELGFHEYRRLSEAVSQGLMVYWEPPSDRPLPEWSGLRHWAVHQTAKAIGKRVYAQWQRLLTHVDPTVLAVQRAIFAATFCRCPLAMTRELYDHKYVVQDLIRYRAAAAAAAAINYLGKQFKRNRFCRSPSFIDAQDPLDLDEALELMAHWRDLFSPTGTTYRSLDRTLMNLPGGIPAGLLCSLAKIHLRRPVFRRLELLALLCHVDAGEPRHGDVFMFAPDEQIKTAMRQVAASTGNELSPRRSRDVHFLVRFLLDFPEDHAGHIGGLTRKSIRWHRDRREVEAEGILERLGGDKETARPPISLPKHAGIRFLGTAGEIVAEGQDMKHCVTMYAEQAVYGQSYFFHVQRNGEHATVQIGRQGQVIQAHGPHNQRNAASSWGQRVLGQWGAQFAKVEIPTEAT